MNVASLELCKELYELSGWEPDTWYDLDPDGKPEQYFATSEDRLYNDENEYVAAYDLGYLLRKLPADIDDGAYRGELRMCKFDLPSAGYAFAYLYKVIIPSKSYEADTPEDAAAKLAIELFKQGVLTK